MRRKLRYPALLVTAVLTATLVGPLGGMAQANHPTGSCLDLSPESETNSLGTTQTITATLRTPSGTTCAAGQTAIDPDQGAVTIHFEITGPNDPDAGNTLSTPDEVCTIQPNQTSCSVSYTGTASGTDLIRGWVDEVAGTSEADELEGENEATTQGRFAEPDGTDVVSATWANPSTASRLDCSPETAVNPAGTSHTVSCTARDTTGALMTNTQIDVEVTGANDPDAAAPSTTPDFTCTTTASGSCQFTHSTGTGASGTSTYRAWVDADGSNNTVEADATEGQDETAQPGATAESDNTDVVTKTWTAGPAVALDCDDQTGPDAERESNPGTGVGDPTSAEIYTCRVVDAANNPADGTFTVRGEVETAVNDPDNPDSASHSSPDYQCNTTNSTCQITVTQAENEVGTTTICFWVGAAVDGTAMCGAETVGESSAADGSDAGNDFTDKVEKTWVSVTTAARLDCTPETDVNPISTSHTITCTATDTSNALVNGANIDVEATGANDPDNGSTLTTPDFTCTTTTTGTCTIVDSTGNATPGLLTYRAWIDRDGSNATVEADTTEARDEAATAGVKAEVDDTDVVTKSWLGPATRVAITPASDSASVGTCNEFTIEVTDAGNQGISNVLIDVEQIHQLASDGVANNEPTVSFCTPTAGANPATVSSTTGDLAPPSESPDNVGTAGGEASVRTDASGRVTIGIAVTASNGADGTGTVTLTAWTESDEDDDPDNNELRGTATKTWVTPQARSITCSPTTATSATGATSVITCTVRDRFGVPVSGEGVVFTSSGPGTLTTATQVTSNASGQVSVTITSLDPGTQTVTATLLDDLTGAEPDDVDECDLAANNPTGAAAGVCAASVTHTWTQAAAASARLTPDERITRVGGESTFSFLVFDASGNPVAGAPVSWSLAGEGRFVSRASETDATGAAIAVLTSNDPGNTIVAAAVTCGATTCTDSSVQHWGPRYCTIFGTNGSEVLEGTSRSDAICGFGGNDRLVGRGRTDHLFGGKGSDTLRGGSGSDSLKGGPGNDSLFGGKATDFLYGGPGDDGMNGGPGTDGCRGGPGRDTERSCEGNIVTGRRRP